MDQGIIKNLKTFYRKQVIIKQFHAAENQFQPNVLDAMRMIKQSWSMVTARTIANCYRHCGFTELPPNVSDDEKMMTISHCPNSQRLHNVVMGAYVNVDNDLLTCNELTDGDIIDDLLMARNPVPEANANNYGSDDNAAKKHHRQRPHKLWRLAM